MQFKNVVLTSLIGAVASAAPAPQSTPAADAKFGLIAIHSGSAVQNQALSASQSNLWISHAQDASCDAESNFATFYLQDGELHLYAASATPQKMYVDRSGMGQGKIGYVTGAQPTPRNGETTGFAISSTNHLQFAGNDFQACKTGMEDGSYSLWAVGNDTPGGNTDCVGVALHVEVTDAPVGCLYSQ